MSRKQGQKRSLLLLFVLLFILLLVLFLVLLIFRSDGSVNKVLRSLEFKLVVDEIVQSDDGADERGQINDEHVVVGVSVEGLDHALLVQIGKQIEDILDLVENGVVDGELSIDDVLQVLVHLLNSCDERFQRADLVANLGRKGRDVGIAHVTKEVLNSNLLSFKSLNGGGDVLETMGSLSALSVKRRKVES